MDINSVRNQTNYIALLLAIVMLIIILYPRIAPFIEYFQQNEIIFRDPDTCYHARRIIYTATHNMKLPFFDPLLAQPRGAIPVWSPLYDWLSALPSFIIAFGKPSKSQIIISAAILTILFGLLQLLFIYLITYRITKNYYYSLLATFLTGISNPQMRYTSLEILDHNSLLLCLFSISLFLVFRIIEKNNSIITLINKILLSFVITSLFWTWPGSFLYIGILFAINIFYCFFAKNDKLSIEFSHIYLLAILFILPLALIHNKYGSNPIAFEYVSFFSLSFLLSLSLIHYLFALIINIKSKKSIKTLPLKIILTILILSILILIQIIPFIKGIKYATAQNSWLSTIIESQPLLYEKIGEEKVFTLSKITTNMSYTIILTPIAIISIIIKKMQLQFPAKSLLIIPSLILAILSIMQQKFIVEFSIFYGILASVFIKWFLEKINKKIIAYALNIIILITASIPAYSSSNDVRSFYITNLALQNAYSYLKNELNQTVPEINSSELAKEGVMTTWGFGHHLHYYSGAATVADNFGFIYLDKLPWSGFFDMVRFYLSQSEQEAIEILNKYKCKYIIVPDYMEYSQLPPLLGFKSSDYFTYKYNELKLGAYIQMVPQPKLVNSVGFRLSEFYGSANPFNNFAKPISNALKFFQLIYELPGPNQTNYPVREGYIKIFKHTEGYNIDINANENEFYYLIAPIISNTGKKFYYQQYGFVKDKIIAPYPIKKIKDYPYALYYKIYTRNKTFTINNF